MITIMKNIAAPLFALTSIVFFGSIYVILNHDNNGVYSLQTDLDIGIPLLKLFVLPYLFWYVYLAIGLVYLCAVNRRGFYRTVVLYNLGLLVCYMVYTYFQTTVPRPVLRGDDWLTSMLSFVYQMDQPYNCFPSIHVFTTYLIMRSIQQYANNSLFKTSVHIVGILIILSTLFIKQHVIFDVIGSFVLVEILYRSAVAWHKGTIAKWINSITTLR